MKSTIELSSIETINRLLSDIFSTFPSVYNSKTDPSDKVFLNVVNPLMERSTYLCKAINNGKLEIKKSAQGGQSVAGPFQITLYKRGEAYVLDIFIASISFKTSGGWTPYMMPLIAKTARRPLYSSCGLGSDRKKGCAALLKMSVTRNNGVIIYVSSDTIHENTIDALTSHLFDIGVAPSLMKYLGLYTCPELNTYILADHLEMGAIPYILMEKSDVELFSLLDMTNVNRVLPNINDEFYAQKKQAQEDAALNINLFDQLNILDFIIIFSQVAHALYVMKYHFNICHYDLHLRNIMLTYTKKVLKYKKNITELSYDGKPLNQVEHYIYQMPFKDGNYPAFLVVENNGLLPKIIDFGHTTASFTHEGIPLKFQNTPEEYDQLNFPEDKLKYYGWDSTWNVTHALNSENKGDLEYNFLLLNFLYKLTLNAGVDRYENIIKNQTFLNFIKSTLPFGPEDIKKSFTGIEKAHSDGKLWLMRKRSVGTTSNIEAPLQKIWKFLTQNVSRQIIDNKVYIVLNRNGENKGKFNIATSVYVPISNNPNLSNMNKFFMANKMLWKDCIINPPKNQKDVSERALKFGLPKDTNVCSKDGLLDISVQKYDPNSKLYLPFFDKIVDGASTSFWNGSMLAKMILPSQMKNFERLNLGKGQIRLYTLKFLPEFTNMNMALEPYHRDVERKMPKNAGDLMKNLNMHLIYINDFPSSSNIRNHFIKISVEKEDLFSTSLEKLQNVKYGVSINGGYFVVGGNINNELTPGLQEKHLRPIGFFFSILAPQYN
nr:hypothetical protein [Saprospiraceae bacterium]